MRNKIKDYIIYKKNGRNYFILKDSIRSIKDGSDIAYLIATEEKTEAEITIGENETVIIPISCTNNCAKVVFEVDDVHKNWVIYAKEKIIYMESFDELTDEINNQTKLSINPWLLKECVPGLIFMRDSMISIGNNIIVKIHQNKAFHQKEMSGSQGKIGKHQCEKYKHLLDDLN